MEQGFPKFFILGPHKLLHNSARVGHLTYCDCFGIYILPNQKGFRQLIFHCLQNILADRIWPAFRSWRLASQAVAILELKKWGGAVRGQGKSRGTNINVDFAW